MAPNLPSMAYLGSLYRTKLTLFSGAVGGFGVCLAANPQRVYLRFDPVGLLGSGSYVYPGPSIGNISVSNSLNLPSEWIWARCPSIVTGDWYTNISSGGIFLITECLSLKG